VEVGRVGGVVRIGMKESSGHLLLSLVLVRGAKYQSEGMPIGDE
jgi:hypothetical protein